MKRHTVGFQQNFYTFNVGFEVRELLALVLDDRLPGSMVHCMFLGALEVYTHPSHTLVLMPQTRVS